MAHGQVTDTLINIWTSHVERNILVVQSTEVNFKLHSFELNIIIPEQLSPLLSSSYPGIQLQL